MIPVDTKNILFICGGAFEGIERKIAMRLNTQVVGYSATRKKEHIDKNNLLQYVAPQDLRAYGLIPEIVGRLPIVTYLNPLDRPTLRRILTEPKDSIIKQYVKLFEIDKISLEFEEGVLDFIVDKAIEFKLGARGLRSICETVMIDAMYELPSQDIRSISISIEYAHEKLERADIGRLKAA